MFHWDAFLAFVFALFTVAALISTVWYALSPLHPLISQARNPWLGKQPGCTILLCARNEADNLRRFLPSVLSQKYAAPFEVLVVDDASDDDTSKVLILLQKNYPHLRVLSIREKKSPGKKHALAQGIESATYDILLCTDADCQPASAHWLETMVRPFFENPQIDIVLGYAALGRLGPAPTHGTLLNRWIRFETVHTAQTYFSFARAGLPYMGVGRNLAWRKHLWAQVGGFAAHAHLPSGDDDLFVSASASSQNTAICLDSRAFVFSEEKKSWSEWYAQKRRHLSTGAFYRPKHRLLLGALALSHSGHYAALLLLTFTSWAYWAWALWALRVVVVRRNWAQTLKTLQEPGLLAWTPLLDAALGVYFGVFGLLLAFSKRPEKW